MPASAKLCAVTILTLGLASAAFGDDLAVWTFETSVPTNAGPHAAEGGIYGGQARGLHADPATVYSNPSGNGSLESFSSNFWSVGDYYEFQTSSVNYQNINIAWDQARSSTGPGTFDLRWSTDGTTFTTLVDNYTVLENSAANGGAWNSTTRILNYVFGPIAGPGTLDNQATIYFRLVNEVAPGGTAGTNRVDNIIVSGTLIPEPATLALLALGGLPLLRRRRA